MIQKGKDEIKRKNREKLKLQKLRNCLIVTTWLIKQFILGVTLKGWRYGKTSELFWETVRCVWSSDREYSTNETCKGTWNVEVSGAEPSARPRKSVTGITISDGADLFATECVTVHSMYVIRWRTGNQCSHCSGISIGVWGGPVTSGLMSARNRELQSLQHCPVTSESTALQ